MAEILSTPPSRKAHRQEKPFIGISPNLAIPISTTPRFMQPTAASRALVGKDPITSGGKPACSPRPAAPFGADAKVTVRAKTPPSRKFAKSHEIGLSPAYAPERDGIASAAAREALSPSSQCIEEERRRAFSTAVPSLDALLSSLEETSPSPFSSPAPDEFHMSPDAAAEAFLPPSPSRRMPLQSRGSASLGSRRPSDAKGTENVYFSLTPPGKGMAKSALASADVLEEALSAGLKRLESPRVSDAMPTAAPVVPNIFSPESDTSVAEEEDTELEVEVDAAAEAPESEVAEAAAEAEAFELGLEDEDTELELEAAAEPEAFELGLVEEDTELEAAAEPEAAEGAWVPSSLQLDGDGLDDDRLDGDGLDDDEIFASSSDMHLASMPTPAPELVDAVPTTASELIEAVPAASIPPGASPVAPETLVARAAAKRAMAALAAARAMSATMSAACAEMHTEEDKEGADAEEEEDEEQLSDNMVEAAPVEPPRPLRSRQFSLDDYEAQKQRRRETAPPMLRPSAPPSTAPRMNRPPSRQQEQPPPQQEQEQVQELPSPAPTSCTKSAAAADEGGLEGGLASPETPQWLRTAEVTLRNTPLPVRPPALTTALTSIKEAAASTVSPKLTPSAVLSKPSTYSAGRSVAALALTLALVATVGGLVSLHMSRPTEPRPTEPLPTTTLPLSAVDIERVVVSAVDIERVTTERRGEHVPTQAVFAPACVDFTSLTRAPKSRPKRTPKSPAWTGSTALVALPSQPEITLPISVRLHAPPAFFHAQHDAHYLDLACSMAACSVAEAAAHGPYSLTGLRLPYPVHAPTPKVFPKVDAARDDAWQPTPAHLALLPFGWHTGAAAELLMPSPPEPDASVNEASVKGAPFARGMHALAIAVLSLALLALSILYNPLRPAGRAALAAVLAAEHTVQVQTTAAAVNPEVATIGEALLSPPVAAGSTRKPKSKGARPPTPPPFLSPGTGGLLAYGSESAYRIEVVQGTEGGVRVTPVRRSKRTGHVEGEASSAVLRGK